MKHILLALLLAVALAAPEEDLVPSLKGYYDYSSEFKMYSGYLTLQAEPLISSHYIFVSSKNAASNDVVLWLNGGPGCSSLLGNFEITQVSCRNMVPTFSTRVQIGLLPPKILSPGTTMPTCFSWKVPRASVFRSTRIPPTTTPIRALPKITCEPFRSGSKSSQSTPTRTSGFLGSLIAACTFPCSPIRCSTTSTRSWKAGTSRSKASSSATESC